MFDHNKGPAENPRHDAYLMGRLGTVFERLSDIKIHSQVRIMLKNFALYRNSFYMPSG